MQWHNLRYFPLFLHMEKQTNMISYIYYFSFFSNRAMQVIKNRVRKRTKIMCATPQPIWSFPLNNFVHVPVPVRHACIFQRIALGSFPYIHNVPLSQLNPHFNHTFYRTLLTSQFTYDQAWLISLSFYQVWFMHPIFIIKSPPSFHRNNQTDLINSQSSLPCPLFKIKGKVRQ